MSRMQSFVTFAQRNAGRVLIWSRHLPPKEIALPPSVGLRNDVCDIRRRTVLSSCMRTFEAASLARSIGQLLDEGTTARTEIRATPREGVISKLLNRFTIEAKVNIRASTKDLGADR